jgi:hypothetical protein
MLERNVAFWKGYCMLERDVAFWRGMCNNHDCDYGVGRLGTRMTGVVG